MKVETALNYKKRFIGYVEDLWSQVRFYKFDFDTYLDEKGKRLYNDPAWKRIPGWVREYVTGYEHALYEQFVRYELDWRLKTKEGTFLPPKAEVEDYSTIDTGGGRHFHKGTDKLW